MSATTQEQVWLQSYLRNYLWVDDDWLELGGHAFTYWQARLAQTTMVQALPDGRAKWRVRTRIVDDVGIGPLAEELCLAINTYAVGWSFVYDAASRSVDAIIAMCAPLKFDMWQLRLSEAAKLSAWMSDVIAERVAETVGGTPAFTHPAHQDAVRETFDGTYYYLETLRGRPEWVVNLTRQLFPQIQDVAQLFAVTMDTLGSDVTVDDSEIRVAIEDTGAHLYGSFAVHPIVGDCWRSAVHFPLNFSGGAAAAVSSMAWQLFADEQSNLMGAWTDQRGELVFTQWNTTSELRNQEQLPSNRGRERYAAHDAGDLWGLTSTLNDAAHITLGADGMSRRATPLIERDDRASLAAVVTGAISDIARPALEDIPTTRGEHADRRLLWLERKHVLVIAAWFNPMGPSIATLEVSSLPDENDEYLVYFMRHPFAPDYRVLGALSSGGDVASTLSAGVMMLLDGGSLPHVLTLLAAPEAVSASLPALFHDEILRLCRESNINLAVDATKLAEAKGRPWDLAPHTALENLTSSEVNQFPESESLSADIDFEAALGSWWARASDPDSVSGIFTHIPDAWDGALNFQISAGNIRMFDTGPFPIRYSSIGIIDEK